MTEASSPPEADRASSSQPLTVVAYRRLVEMITSGELAPGAIVQERRLAKELDISRTPLRDALFRLEGEGLLVRHAEGVLQVKSFTLQDYARALDVRVVLEREAARLAAGHVPTREALALREQLERILARAAGAEPPSRQELDRVDDALHDALAEHCGNPLLAEFIRTVRQRSRLVGLERRPRRILEITREHLEILGAVADGDAAGAQDAMERHLRNTLADLRDRMFSPR